MYAERLTKLDRQRKRFLKESIPASVFLERLSVVEHGSGLEWKIDTKRTKAGDVFGSLDKGYWRGDITIDGTRYRYAVHRLKYFLVHKDWPEVVDHIDGNPRNNNIKNLRGCTQSQNLHNQGIRSTNRSGHKGIKWIERLSKWHGSFNFNNKYYGVGYHDRLEDAVKALRRKREEIVGEYAKHT